MNTDETEVQTDKELFDYIIATAGNKINRIAVKAMIELIKTGGSSFLVLRDEEVADWWSKLVNESRDNIEDHKDRLRKYDLKLQAYEKLSPAERRALGIRKPTKVGPLIPTTGWK